MTDTPAEQVPAHSAFRVLAALAELGEATAAAIADHTGLGYSTVTPKLRAWHASGHAERFRDPRNRTLWRLTDSGRAATATIDAADQRIIASDDLATSGVSAIDGDSADARSATTATVTLSGDVPDDAAEAGLTRSAPASPDADADPRSRPEPGAASEADASHAGPVTDVETPSVGGAPAPTASGTRRPSGSLGASILDILEADPGRGYTVSALCKRIDAEAGEGAPKVSPGAVANAAHKLVENDRAILLDCQTATFDVRPAS